MGRIQRVGRLLESVLPAMAFALAFRVAVAQAYVVDGPSMQPNLVTGERLWVRVPSGHVFVLGDHRDVSNDSRAFGAVPVALLRGRLLFRE